MMHGLKARLAAGLVGVAAVAVPAIALAQSGEPPAPPYGLVFGSADGATVGQPVIAFVTGGPSAAHCGFDTVKDDDVEGIVYAVSINAQGQTPGCGEAGRQVRLYFAGMNGGPSAFATPVFTLDASYQGGKEQDVTLGSPLANRLYAPGLRAAP